MKGLPANGKCLSNQLLKSYKQAAEAYGLDAGLLKESDTLACLSELAKLVLAELPGDPFSEIAATSNELLGRLAFSHHGMSMQNLLLQLKAYRAAFLNVLTHHKQSDIHALFDQLEVRLLSSLFAGEQQPLQWSLSPERGRYLAIFDYIPQPVVLMDLSGAVVHMNQLAQDLFQVEREQYQGQPVHDVLPWFSEIKIGELTGRTVLEQTIELNGSTHYTSIAVARLEIGRGLQGIIMVVHDLTRLKEVEERLKRTRHRLLDIIEFLPDATFAVNLKGEITVWNQAMEELTGVPKQEMIGKGEHSYSIPFFGETRKGMFERILKGVENPENATQYELLQHEGDTYYAEVFAPCLHGGEGAYVWAKSKPMYNLEGKVVGVIQSIRDITERRRYREALEVSERRLRHITDNLLDIICETDERGQILYVSQSAARVLGYQPTDLLGTSVFELVHPDDLFMTQEVLRHAQSRPRSGRMEFRCIRSDGSYIWVETIGNTTYDSQGQLERVILAIRDISARRSLEDRLRYLSSHDGLTGLYNRSYLQRLMKELDLREESHVGLLFCDVDGLKLVNDTMGHEAGDNLLLELVKTIKQSCRLDDIVARVGGDEFAVLLRRANRQQLDDLCTAIRRSVDAYNNSTPKLHLSVSIGTAVSDQGYIAMNALFKEADDRMYREKLHRSQSTRSAIVQTLMTALEARDFLTEGHAERMQDQVADLGKALGLGERDLVDLRLLAQFHDIGKVGIPDRILFKPGPLSEQERTEMKRHSEIGHRIAQSAPDLMPIADLILKHHEWWNGQGYPLGLSGVEVPLACRILAITDAYDAMTSDRPYRAAMPKERALDELRAKAGSQFDPALVPLFCRLVEQAE